MFLTVERGLRELRKLGIEQQLWEASRKENDQPSYASIVNHKPSYVSIVNRKPVAESDYSPWPGAPEMLFVLEKKKKPKMLLVIFFLVHTKFSPSLLGFSHIRIIVGPSY